MQLKWLPGLRNRIMPLHLVLLCGCILLGAGLRLHALQAHSLWFDEILTAMRSREELGWLLWGSPPVRFRPVSYVLTHFFLLLLGESDFIVRLPSVMEGVLSIAVMYKVGTALYGRIEGTIGALLLALSPFHICYSQEARFYALMLLLSLLTVLFLWKAATADERRYMPMSNLFAFIGVQRRIPAVVASATTKAVTTGPQNRCGGVVGLEGRKWFWAAFFVTTALNVYNHPVACFVLVAELAFVGLTWLWEQRTVSWQVSLYSAIGALILGLVLLTVGPLYYSALPDDVKFPLVLPGGEEGTAVRLSPSIPLNLFSAFGAGGGLALYVFAEVALLGLLVSCRPGTRKVLLLLLSMLCLPLLMLPFVRGTAPFAYKYFIFMLPLYLLLVARGMTGLGEIIHAYIGQGSSLGKAIPVAVCLLLVSLDLAAVRDYYRQRTEDWREMGAFLRQNARSGEIIVSPLVYPEPYLTSGAHILSYYDPIGQEGADFSVTTSPADLEKTYLRHEKVWLVLVPPYTVLPEGTTDWLSGHEYLEYSFHPRFKVLCINNNHNAWRDRSTDAVEPLQPLTSSRAAEKK